MWIFWVEYRSATGTRMVVKWSRDCEKACFTYHCPGARWCDTGVGQSTSGGLARRWRHAVGKKSPWICRSDARQRASGSESAALQSLRKFVPLLRCMLLLFRKQRRTGKDSGSGRRFDLRNPSGRESASKVRRDCRAALPLPLALVLPVGCIRYSLRMGFKTLSFFALYLAGRLERPA